MKYRDNLPYLHGTPCITDGGLETCLIFEDGIDLPCFASYVVLEREDGREILQRYMRPYTEIARENGIGLLLDTPTWRANPDWGRKIGHSQRQLDRINAQGVTEMQIIRDAAESDSCPMPISGCIGPRGDGYVAGQMMTPDEAARYHNTQIRILAEGAADIVTAYTLGYSAEAAGIARAAAENEIPAAISFTIETDGRLPGGETLGEAIRHCDAESGGYASYYMINCAHPVHIAPVFDAADGAPWVSRVRGLRANASMLSHAELDEATELDDGDPSTLGGEIRALTTRAENLSLFGGCCGTDHRHLRSIAAALACRV